MKRVDVAGVAVEQTSGAPFALLQEQDAPHRLLPIVIGGPEATSIALAVSGQAPPRPLTHDVMAALLESLDATVDAAEVTELTDGTYHARLIVTGAGSAHHLDARPSDAIALAVRLGAPLLVSEEVLDEAGTVPTPPEDIEFDAADIDETVDEFRAFLDDIEPVHFALDAGDEPAPEHPDPPAGDEGEQ
ncbi:MAG: bifunctional nuclease family protein [Acidimicrobiia bacterium]|nr:bifunctional nuclease family protein [Acidimicrobiia bacterium]